MVVRLAMYGLDRMQQRYYDPAVGRFLSVDPMASDMQNGWNFNRYNYAANNPYRFIDPDGREVDVVFDVGTGKGEVIDKESGTSVSFSAVSGGRPVGDPIPVGRYDILDHPKPNNLRLEPLDANYGDDTIDATGRDEFRLHQRGAGRTIGCISVTDDSEWESVSDVIGATRTSTVEVESKSRNPFSSKYETVKKYGTLEVRDSSSDGAARREDSR